MGVIDSDAVIAGGVSDFLEARHVVLRGTNREIGFALASMAKDAFGVSPWYAPDPVVATAIHTYHREHYPVHADRVVGAMEAFGVPGDDRGAAPVALPFLLPRPGCSVATIAPRRSESGHALVSKYYDFPLVFGGGTATGSSEASVGDLPTASRPYLLEVYPDEGYPSMYLAQYDLLTGVHDGVNSEGLGVGLLADDESNARYGSDMPTTFGVGMHAPMLLRFLLDTCANVPEAKAALLRTKQYPFLLHTHLTISDRHGDAFIWEKSPLNGTEHIIDRDGDVQTLTNHLLSDPEPAQVSVETDVGWTRTRLARLTAAVDAIGGAISPDDMKQAHETVRMTKRIAAELTGSAEIANDLGGRTIWHALLDLENREIEVSFYLGDNPDGTDRRSPYQTFRLAL